MTPLWPARLHHLKRCSAEPERLARWYAELLGDRLEPLANGEWLVQGHQRRLLVGRGAPGAVPSIALAMRDGPIAGLEVIDRVLTRGELLKYQFAHSARGELLRRAGKLSDARSAFQRALELAQTEPEQRFLTARINQLAG